VEDGNDVGGKIVKVERRTREIEILLGKWVSE
jgi:hypothetical protein